MKPQNVIFVSLMLITSMFFGCNETNTNDPDTEVNIEDYLYDAQAVKNQCASGKILREPSCTPIRTVSMDRTIFFYGSSSSHPILYLWNGKLVNEVIDLSPINRADTIASSVTEVHFSPYDNNLGLILVNFAYKQGTNDKYFHEWYYHNFATKTFELLQLNEAKFEEYKNYNKFVRWLNASTPGNDKFFFNDNRILIYSQKEIIANPTGLVLRENEKVHSVSPDGKKIFTNLNDELYLNGTKIEKSIFKFWEFLPINWSDDSKYFMGVGLEANPGAHLNIVYRMEEGSNDKFKIHKIIDITRKYCSIQHPETFGYGWYSTTHFMSNSTFLISLFPQANYYGNVYEMNFQGDTLRKLTGY
jgi:hypothetical protein